MCSDRGFPEIPVPHLSVVREELVFYSCEGHLKLGPNSPHNQLSRITNTAMFITATDVQDSNLLLGQCMSNQEHADNRPKHRKLRLSPARYYIQHKHVTSDRLFQANV